MSLIKNGKKSYYHHNSTNYDRYKDNFIIKMQTGTLIIF